MQVKQLTREEYPKRINKFTEYVNNHLDGELDINTLAEVSNFSGFHFNRIVKAFLGETIGVYIYRIRIETAARLLRYSDLPVQEISERIGYEACLVVHKPAKPEGEVGVKHVPLQAFLTWRDY